MNIEELSELLSRVDECCTNKERDFLKSAKSFLIKTGRDNLTHGQQSWVQSISEKYSEEKIQEEIDWKRHWSPEHRTQATRVAHYYAANPPYFGDLSLMILSNTGDFYLTKRQWNKLCCNKYAKKILNQYEIPAKFSKGECIQVRATNKIRSLNLSFLPGRSIHSSTLPNRTGFVLSVNSKPITRYAKGSRIYSILLTGDTKPLFVHESDIKKRRAKK